MLDTYSIATMGYNVSPESIAALGFIYSIEIEEIPEENIIIPEETGGAISEPYVIPVREHNPLPEKEKKKKYKISVTVTVNEKIYTAEKIVSDIKKPKIEDVKIEIDNTTIPQIKINLTE